MSDIETRLGRIEGSLDMYTKTLTGVVDRMEVRQTRLEETVTAIKVSEAKRTGMVTMLSATLSGIIAVTISLYKGN